MAERLQTGDGFGDGNRKTDFDRFLGGVVQAVSGNGQRVLDAPDVIEAVKLFVPLKLDYDLHDDLAKQFFVHGLPYVAVTDRFGSLVNFRHGFGSFNAEDLKQIYKDAPKDSAILEKAFNRVELKKTTRRHCSKSPIITPEKICRSPPSDIIRWLTSRPKFAPTPQKEPSSP